MSITHPPRGIPFATFAHQRIRGAILDEIRRQPPRWIWRSRGVGELSLDATIATPEGDVRLADMTADPSSPSPAAHVELNELLDAAGGLPRRERDMIALQVKGYTVTEIADLHGCSETRASQLLARARLRLSDVGAAREKGAHRERQHLIQRFRRGGCHGRGQFAQPLGRRGRVEPADHQGLERVPVARHGLDGQVVGLVQCVEPPQRGHDRDQALELAHAPDDPLLDVRVEIASG